MSDTRVTIVGGGIAGLMAAREAEEYYDDILLYDEGSYEGDRRGPWGEMIWNYQLLNIDRDIPGYAREVEAGIFDYEGDQTKVDFTDGVIVNRGELEKYLATNLEKTEVNSNTEIDEDEFSRLAEESDLLIDATGPFPISNYYTDLEYESVRPTISGRVEDDFSELYPEPRGIGYKNYFLWIGPQSEDEAIVGLGCSPENNPEELYSDLKKVLKEHNISVPDKEFLHRGVDVSTNIENLRNCSYSLNNCDVMIIGSAAGLNNEDTGFGITHAARSARIAVNSFKNNDSYTEELIEANKLRLESQEVIFPIQKKVGGLKVLSKLSRRDMDYESIFEPSRNRQLVGELKDFIPKIFD